MPRKSKQEQSLPKQLPLPLSPEQENARWLPPGERKNTPPLIVPKEIKRGPRQVSLPLKEDDQ